MRHHRYAVAALCSAILLSSLALGDGLPTSYRTLTVDGIRMGDALDGATGASLAPAITFVGTGLGSGTFHMWYHKSFTFTADAHHFLIAPITDIYHATSQDGLTFTTTGHLQFSMDPFTGPTPYAFSATVYPPLIYQKIVQVNGGYTLLTWTDYDGSNTEQFFGGYDYNISASDIGLDPNNLTITHRGAIGPIGGGIAGQSAGPWGLLGGKIYFENNGNLGRADYTDHGLLTFPKTGNPFADSPFNITGDNLTQPIQTAQLITSLGFGYCTGAMPVYPENHASVIDGGNGSYYFYYTLTNCNSGFPENKEIYVSTSHDGGVTWSAPVPGFPSGGSTVTVDGGATGGNFADPEAVLVGTQQFLYFNTIDLNGHAIVVGPTRPPVDVSAKVRVTENGFARNRATLIWTSTMTVTNTSASTIQGPIQVVLTDLSPNAMMVNASGKSGGNPYITVTNGALASGASASVLIQFTNSTNGFITFTPVTYSGGF